MLSTRISEAEVGQTAYHIPSDNDCEYTAVTAIVQPSKRNKKRGREKERERERESEKERAREREKEKDRKEEMEEFEKESDCK